MSRRIHVIEDNRDIARLVQLHRLGDGERDKRADADFAADTANLTQTQILPQAGTAMLAHANALPQNVLSFL